MISSDEANFIIQSDKRQKPPRWVDFGWLPRAHQAALSLYLLSRTREKKYNKKLMGQNKDGDTIYWLKTWAKQTWPREIILIYC